jgi:hypothetical protein
VSASSVPPALRRHILPFNWDVRRVWRLPTSAQSVAREELDYLLELPLWSSVPQGGMLFDISPRQVLADPQVTLHQYQRIQEADLAFPIDMLDFEGVRWILDGVHRLAKHFLLDHASVDLRLHPSNVVPQIKA